MNVIPAFDLAALPDLLSSPVTMASIATITDVARSRIFLRPKRSIVADPCNSILVALLMTMDKTCRQGSHANYATYKSRLLGPELSNSL